MGSRQARIEFLARQNIRRLRSPKFLADASDVIGETIGANAVAEISATDTGLARFRVAYRSVVDKATPAFRLIFELREETRLFSFVDCLAESLRGQRAVWLTNAENEPIAVEIELFNLLRCCKSAIRFDRNSISAISLDQTQGLLLDNNVDDRQNTYELAIWGDQWRGFALKCANQ